MNARALVQRIVDALRERRIKALDKEAVAHMAKGRLGESRNAYMRMCKEITQRSSAQVARMEQRRGLSR